MKVNVLASKVVFEGAKLLDGRLVGGEQRIAYSLIRSQKRPRMEVFVNFQEVAIPDPYLDAAKEEPAKRYVDALWATFKPEELDNKPIETAEEFEELKGRAPKAEPGKMPKRKGKARPDYRKPIGDGVNDAMMDALKRLRGQA